MNVNWKDYAGFAIPPRMPCCDCPASCGYFNITAGLYPFYVPGTIAEASAALATYATACKMFSYPITVDYEYTSKGYSKTGDTIAFSGGAATATGVLATSASYSAAILVSVSAGILVVNGSYSTECTPGYNYSASGNILIVGEGVYESIDIDSATFPVNVSIPAATCLTITISASVSCNCPPPTPPDPPPDCPDQNASASVAADFTMAGIEAQTISIDYIGGELICT